MKTERCCTDMRAMILAAGFGKRLRPYTLLRPKPLFPVCNRPLLDILLEHLANAGFHDVVVNAHHLADQMEQYLRQRPAGPPRVQLRKEATLLGTGGGLRMARPHFGAAPVLVWNGDIYAAIDPARVMEEHRRAGAAATLVVHDHPRYNNVAVSDDGRILGFGDDRLQLRVPFRSLAFTGIQVLAPEILRHLPADTFASILDCHRAVIREGGHIQALFVRDHYWNDIGTPADYLALHQTLLTGTEGRLPSLSPSSPFHVSTEARVASKVRFTDWAVVGAGAIVGEGASLARVVVWDGARVPAGAELANAIIT